jgi:hypothetical protein
MDESSAYPTDGDYLVYYDILASIAVTCSFLVY